jgi:hypothetical protein
MGAQWVLEMAEDAIAVSGSQHGDVIVFTING